MQISENTVPPLLFIRRLSMQILPLFYLVYLLDDHLQISENATIVNKLRVVLYYPFLN